MLLSASIEFSGKLEPVRLRDVSAEGALIESDQLPEQGSVLVFRRKAIVEKARVVWVSGRRAGIRFTDALGDSMILRNLPALASKSLLTMLRRPR